MFMLSLNIGVMVGYALSSAYDYTTVGFICIGFPITSTVLSFFILHDTPHQLIKMKRDEDAKKSLRFYRNCRGDIQEVDDEFEAIKNGIIEAQGKNEKITLSDFSKSNGLFGKLSNTIFF